MWKFIDISGFRTSNTTYGYIIKYIKCGYNDLHFQLIFTNDFIGDDEYHFEGNNISDISKFHNILKNNGSTVMFYYKTKSYILLGKKLMSITEDAPFYKLEAYDEHPLDSDNAEILNIEPTNIKLIEIFKEQLPGNDYSDEYWNMLIA